MYSAFPTYCNCNNKLNIKKIKSTRIILQKIIKKNKNKKKRTMWGNTVAIHNVLKKIKL
jgi:hypothetical protein